MREWKKRNVKVSIRYSRKKPVDLKPAAESIRVVGKGIVRPEQQRTVVNFGFAHILCKPENTEEFIETLGLAYAKNRAFFSRKINRFNLVIAYSKLEVDRLLERNSHENFISSANSQNIFLFYPRVVEEIPSLIRRKVYLKKLLTHEVNHVFYSQITGSHKPKWLCEGLANYLSDYFVSDDYAKRLKRERPQLCYKLYKSKFNQQIKHLYPMSYLAVKYLVEKEEGGLKKLFEAICEFSKDPTKERFNAAFLLKFGFPVREVRDRMFSNI